LCDKIQLTRISGTGFFVSSDSSRCRRTDAFILPGRGAREWLARSCSEKRKAKGRLFV
jgi:imidazoleglycerol phosphate synthase glutamine amidotransferase subunit HisH